jgi:hypothetical protein
LPKRTFSSASYLYTMLRGPCISVIQCVIWQVCVHYIHCLVYNLTHQFFFFKCTNWTVYYSNFWRWPSLDLLEYFCMELPLPDTAIVTHTFQHYLQNPELSCCVAVI